MGFMSFECGFGLGLGCIYFKVNEGYLFCYRFLVNYDDKTK